MEKVYKSIDKCCGCNACEKICPTNAISMVQNNSGFYYPKINKGICVDCKLCTNVCPFIKLEYNFQNQKYYAFKNKDINALLNSSSGGFFSMLVDWILNKQGVFYGVIFEDKKVIYKRLSKKQDLSAAQGSKYVDSRMYNVYNEVKSDLNNGIKVLFSGLPCHVLALKKYLKIKNIKTSNLVLVDLICHGTPSELVWQKYIEFIEKKYESKVKYFTFRNKQESWENYPVKIIMENGKIIQNNKDARMYLDAFFSYYINKPSCYDCPFSRLERIADITMGDCWGIETFNPSFYDKKGVSLIIVNTDKGKSIFQDIKEHSDYEELKIDDFISFHGNLQKHSNRKPFLVNRFWDDFNKKKFESLHNKYFKRSMKNRILNYYFRKIQKGDK